MNANIIAITTEKIAIKTKTTIILSSITTPLKFDNTIKAKHGKSNSNLWNGLKRV